MYGLALETCNGVRHIDRAWTIHELGTELKKDADGGIPSASSSRPAILMVFLLKKIALD
jgi:hypothetical protein